MKRISKRAFTVVLLALMVIAGMGLFVNNYRSDGKDWALYFSRENSGAMGIISDRNGISLANFNSTTRAYADDPQIRRACYHVTGDYWGRTGTGLLTVYERDFTSYNPVTGTTRADPYEMRLTIDAMLSKTALEAMGGNNGAVMMMNYRTGEVLVMLSTPTIDPADGSLEPADGTFINKCISARFTPGSVFKLVTSAAALETVNPDSWQFYCEAEYEIAGVTISCMTEHWTQSFESALANSCNVAFAQLTVAVGQTAMVQHVEDYGFLSKHSLDGLITAAGSYPTEFVGDPELAWSGIGQSTDLIVPYTLLRYVAAVANGGMLTEPTLFLDNANGRQTRLIREDTARRMASLMAYTVSAHYDPNYNFPGLNLSAKTGTAELGDGTSHAWFAGFLNDEQHPYAFVVLVERGGSGLAAAGSVANSLLQAAVR